MPLASGSISWARSPLWWILRRTAGRDTPFRCIWSAAGACFWLRPGRGVPEVALVLGGVLRVGDGRRLASGPQRHELARAVLGPGRLAGDARRAEPRECAPVAHHLIRQLQLGRRQQRVQREAVVE